MMDVFLYVKLMNNMHGVGQIFKWNVTVQYKTNISIHHIPNEKKSYIQYNFLPLNHFLNEECKHLAFKSNTPANINSLS